jgi:hypothetical protein
MLLQNIFGYIRAKNYFKINVFIDCFGLCNVVTALDPTFERLLYEDFNGGFRFKGG